jgi:hypothetical protein
MDRDFPQLQVRWTMALERYIADYAEPTSPNGYYSVRSARKMCNRLGRSFEPDARHQNVWKTLLIFAHDLRKSVTHTWVGKETLKQLSGMSGTALRDTIMDLQAMGFITISRRVNQTNQINIHLVPIERGHERDYVVEEVSIAPEDLGIYICQAARDRGESFDTGESADPEESVVIVRMLEDVFPLHPSFETARQKAALSRYITGCVSIAGPSQRCFDVLSSILSDQTAAGQTVVDKIEASASLGAYLQKCFPGWLAAYNSQRVNDDVIATI